MPRKFLRALLVRNRGFVPRAFDYWGSGRWVLLRIHKCISGRGTPLLRHGGPRASSLQPRYAADGAGVFGASIIVLLPITMNINDLSRNYYRFSVFGPDFPPNRR